MSSTGAVFSLSIARCVALRRPERTEVPFPYFQTQMTIQKTLLCLLLTLSATSLPAFEFGWKLDRGYKYLWLKDKEKIGETVFRFSRKEGVAGGSEYYQLASQRKMEAEGKIQDSVGTLLFSKDGAPATYTEKTSFRFASDKSFSAYQEASIQFNRDLVTTIYTNNRKKGQESRKELKIGKDTFLFSTLCQEQWNLFTGKLDTTGPGTIKVLYPEFSEVLKIDFKPEVQSAPLTIGDRKIPVTRFSFEAKKWKWQGSIWVDAKGRMIQYASGPLKVVLTGKID